MLNHYGPVLAAWPEPYFVTLTRRTVPVESLGDTYVNSLSIFNAVKKGHAIFTHGPVETRGVAKN